MCVPNIFFLLLFSFFFFFPFGFLSVFIFSSFFFFSFRSYTHLVVWGKRGEHHGLTLHTHTFYKSILVLLDLKNISFFPLSLRSCFFDPILCTSFSFLSLVLFVFIFSRSLHSLVFSERFGMHAFQFPCFVSSFFG